MNNNFDEKYFKEIYEKVSNRKKKYYHFLEYVIRLKGRNIKILDVGCAYGFLIEQARELGLDAYGLEYSKYAIEKSKVKEYIVHGSAESMPFPSLSFDVIFAFDVVEHLPNPEKAISEFSRVLKDNGILILTTPHPKYPGDWIHDPTHINVHVPEYWVNNLKSNGFKIKLFYIPAFLKYYSSITSKLIPKILDPIIFNLEEPIRYLLGHLFKKKGRVYICGKKVKNR